MKKLKVSLFVGFMMSFIFPVGEACAVFLLIAPGAAPQSAGEANVARVEDAYATYYNPASLAFQDKPSIVGHHVNWLPNLASDLYYEFIGYSIPLGDLGGLGGHIIFLDLGEQLATDEQGTTLGQFKSYMWALDAGFGTRLTEKSALGLGFKVYYQKLADAVVADEAEGKPYSYDFAFAYDSDSASDYDYACDCEYDYDFVLDHTYYYDFACDSDCDCYHVIISMCLVMFMMTIASRII